MFEYSIANVTFLFRLLKSKLEAKAKLWQASLKFYLVLMLLQEVCQAQKEEGNRGKSKMKYDYEEFGGTG